MHCKHHSAAYHAHLHEQAKARAHALRQEAVTAFWRKVFSTVCTSVSALAHALVHRRTTVPRTTSGV
jgi:hypothetical protein